MTLTMLLEIPIPPGNIRPLTELKGPASLLSELVDEEGRSRVEYALRLGLPVFEADGVYLTPRPVFDMLMEAGGSRFDRLETEPAD
jgi:hypothetical protein